MLVLLTKDTIDNVIDHTAYSSPNSMFIVGKNKVSKFHLKH